MANKSRKDRTNVVGEVRFTVDREEYKIKAVDGFSFGTPDEH